MEPIPQQMIIQAVQAATTEVFAAMLGVDVEPAEPYMEASPPSPTEGVVSLIGLVGRWVGTGSLSCSASFACRLSSLMLQSESHAVDGEVLDAIAELTNMIIGNVKTSIEEEFGPMDLSIPTVVFGRNFIARSVGDRQWTVVPFSCGGEQLLVKVCLAPNRNPQNCTRPKYAMV